MIKRKAGNLVYSFVKQ